MAKEKHNFVEDDIIAEKSLKGEYEEEPKTLKDIPCFFESGRIKDSSTFKEDLKQLAISHIKYMRREGRDDYYANIDEKSAIPWIINFFNLTEVEPKKENPVEKFL